MMENRYDKYKDSGIAWIGEIPEHWKITKIQYLAQLKSGYSLTTEEITDNGLYPVYGGNGIRGYYDKYFLEGDYVLIGRQGALCGNINYSTNKSWATEHAVVCYPKIKYVTRWFGELLRVMNLNQYSLAAAQPGLAVERIKLLPIPIIPLPEQQSIAAYLDQKCGEIDELITLQEEMITKLQSYKQSVITEAVTKGLDKNVPLKDSGIEWIGEIPEHWICTVFKRFLLEPMQYGANEPAEECNYYDPRYIRITDIKDDGTLRDDTFKSLPLGKAKEYMLTKGDLLFARSGATVGKTFLYKEDYAACFAGYLIKARCNKNKLVPNFVFYYTLSNVYQNWKNSIFIQSTIQNIGADKYSVMPIIVPPLSEQQAIADYLDQRCSEIDELISIKQQKIEKLKEYKKSLIFECVTGKRKVC